MFYPITAFTQDIAETSSFKRLACPYSPVSARVTVCIRVVLTVGYCTPRILLRAPHGVWFCSEQSGNFENVNKHTGDALWFCHGSASSTKCKRLFSNSQRRAQAAASPRVLLSPAMVWSFWKHLV